MSKYTTEVRYICEQKANVSEKLGFYSVDDILNKSWDKIFTTKVNIFDEQYRPIICKKILKHYYTREIGAESVGLWQLWLNTTFEEIIPYYNKLYKSELLTFNPLYDVDYTRTGYKKNTGNKDKNINTNTNKINTTNVNRNDIEKYSDTPQGSIQDLASDRYLTNATITNNSENSTNKDNANTIEIGNEKTNDIENYFERITGKTPGKNYSEMLLDFRKTFLNIDMMVIDEFKDLFLNLW